MTMKTVITKLVAQMSNVKCQLSNAYCSFHQRYPIIIIISQWFPLSLVILVRLFSFYGPIAVRTVLEAFIINCLPVLVGRCVHRLCVYHCEYAVSYTAWEVGFGALVHLGTKMN